MKTTPAFSSKERRLVCGYPRSGNNWLARLLGDLTNSPVSALMEFPSLSEEGLDRPGPYVWIQRHLRVSEVEAPAVLIIRDPRDVVVSLVHYRELGSIQNAIDINKEWFGQNDKALKRFMETWQDFNRHWLESDHPNTYYEWLQDDPVGELKRIAEAMKLEVAHDYDQVVARQSFDQRRKLIDTRPEDQWPYGPVMESRQLRKGVSGDWVNHFDRSVGEYLAPLLWPMIKELGYEEDEAWWQKLPEAVNEQ